ncbi:MAG: ComF family protein [Armatimonadetes bacterium]|nr:ComF family protein [Armatimonadota bacterium]
MDTIRAVARYEGVAKEAVHALKFGRRRALAGPLGTLMGTVAFREWGARPPDLVVPVPLHPARERERSFNQAHLLAVEVAAVLGAPLAPAALRRVRATPQQTGLAGDARRENVAGAFEAEAGAVRGRRILLVDDVMTTGATLEASAEPLRRAGAREVCAVVMARSLGGQ